MKAIFQKIDLTFIFSVLAFIVLVLISLVNHYNYETFALDLGAYTNALYNYIHLEPATTAVFEEQPKLLLADHFDLYLVFFSPLVYIFGSYSLLIVQLIAAIIGSIGLVKLLTKLGVEFSKFSVVYFLSYFGVISAFSFDYHSNVIASMLIPWLLVFLLNRNLFKYYTLLIFLLISKENFGLILCFVLIGLAFEKSFKETRKHIYASALISILFSAIVIILIMPSIGETATYSNYQYSIGSDFESLLFYAFTEPLSFLGKIFGNHLPDSKFPVFEIKLEMLIFFFGTGGLLLILRPWLLICFLPVFLQKFLHNNVNIVGVGSHYSIEIAILLAIFCPFIISRLNFPKQNVAMIILTILSFGFTIRFMDKTVNYSPKHLVRFYQKMHYVRPDIGRAAINSFMKKVPDKVSVSASSNLLPHLICRKQLYQFPIIHDAEYIVIGDFKNSFPISKDEKSTIVDSLISNSLYRIITRKDGLTLLQKE